MDNSVITIKCPTLNDATALYEALRLNYSNNIIYAIGLTIIVEFYTDKSIAG